MTAIRIHTHLDSETLHLPELRPIIGKDVEIIVVEEESAEPLPAPTHPLLGLKPYQVGHARECTFRREDIYGDNGHSRAARRGAGHTPG